MVWLVAAPASAADALITGWNSGNCTGCHLSPVDSAGNNTSTATDDYFKILGMYLLSQATLTDDATILSKMRAYCTNEPTPHSYMCTSNASYFTSSSDGGLISAYKYLVAARHTAVAGSTLVNKTLTFAGLTKRGFPNPATQSFTISNYRDQPLNYTKTSLSDYIVTPSSGCASQIPMSTATAPGVCTFTVQFSPAASVTVPDRTTTLTFNIATPPPPTTSPVTVVPPSPAPVVITLVGSADIPPTANAGTDVSLAVTGSTIALSGTASDANGAGTLSYSWSFVTKPGTSTTTLSNATTLSPSFTADKSGLYTVRLTVSDGNFTATDTVDVTADARPIADAGVNQSVTIQSATMPMIVTLNGGGSADPDGDAITAYAWSVTRNGSPVTLNLTDPVHPTFSANLGGLYNVTLAVSDGRLMSTNTATVTVRANTRPTANAGSTQSVATTTLVHLNGGASTDPDGDTIVSYAWTLQVPPTSAATLTGANTKTPTFTPDIVGDYRATLVVNDGMVDSVPSAAVLITAFVGNAPPVAHATASPNPTTVGTPVQLDGSSSSDANGDPLTYAWTLTKPSVTSTAALSNPTSKTPSFVPDVAGTYNVSLTVNDGTVNSTSAFAIDVVVSLPAPILSLNATTLPITAAVSATATTSAVITNTGTAPLVLGALTFAGPQAAEFSLAVGNGCTASLSIAAGANCTLVVSFAPLATGSRSATLSIASNAAGSPQVVTLQGTASAAPQGRIELSAFTLTFDDTTVADTSSKTLTVHNGGNFALTLTGIALGGVASADYSFGGSCAVGVPLAILADCTIVVSFHPSIAGQRVGLLTIQSDASNGAATVTLTGKALPLPAPAVTLDPAATLEFGAQTVSGLYPPRHIVLSNSGNAELTIATIAATGSAFAIAPDSSCPTTLPAGASCVISVAFVAPAVGTFDGSVRVTSNAAGSPNVIALHGSGSAAAVPVLTWSPAATALDFGMVSSGTVSAAQSVFLKNNGPGGVLINFANATGPDNIAFAVDTGTCPTSSPLFEGATCRIDVRFAPGSAGAKRANLQVASSGTLPPPIALSGTGLSGPSPGLTPSVSTLDMGTSMVGASSLPAEIVIRSDGSGVVNIASIEVTGPYEIQPSSTCPPTPFALAAGLNCTISLQFKPTGPGPASGTVQITSDASPSVRTIALSSKANAPAEVSSGGCTIAGGAAPLDPTLPLFGLAAIGLLAARGAARERRRRAAARREGAS